MCYIAIYSNLRRVGGSAAALGLRSASQGGYATWLTAPGMQADL